MIRITFFTDSSDNNNVIGFESVGHAGYDESGKDIICAATSMLVINTINSLEQFTEDDFEVTVDEYKAIISMRLKSNKKSKECSVLLKSLELGLTEVAKDNPEYISITFKEV